METNDDYATVIDRIDTEIMDVRYVSRRNEDHQPGDPRQGQQPGVPRQGGRESQHVLVDNDYHVLEQSNEERSGMDHDYCVLEQLDEGTVLDGQ